jgi:hypothetical protein
MTTVDELFDRFRAAYHAGEPPDPGPLLEGLAPGDRRELAVLIDAFLANDPGRPFDEAAYARFEQDPLTQRIAAEAAALANADGETWATLLPAARNEARISRATLVSRLATALGVGDRSARVGDYYHEMESGLLPADGVSQRVLQALSDLVGVSMERLAAAGRRAGPAGGGAAAAVFARSTPGAAEPPGAASPVCDAPLAEPWDEVDELFRGGRD